MKHVYKLSLALSMALFSCIIEHDNEPICGDKQGTVDDACANVFFSAPDYKSDGSSYETILLVFHPEATSAIDLLIYDTDGLIEQGVYTTGSTLNFSGKESQTSMEVNITEVTETDGTRTISGFFTFIGTFAENFQSYNISKEGTFNDVIIASTP